MWCTACDRNDICMSSFQRSELFIYCVDKYANMDLSGTLTTDNLCALYEVLRLNLNMPSQQETQPINQWMITGRLVLRQGHFHNYNF